MGLALGQLAELWATVTYMQKPASSAQQKPRHRPASLPLVTAAHRVSPVFHELEIDQSLFKCGLGPPASRPLRLF